MLHMHELQQIDKKVVLSVKALETIYHMVSSSIGKLISGKQYLGGYALKQVRDKVEAEGKELPFRKKKKLPQRSSGLAKTSSSTMEHWKTQDDMSKNEESFRNLQCRVRKFGKKKLKTKQWKLRRFEGFTHEVMPAGCGLDFEGISSPQSTAITARKINS